MGAGGGTGLKTAVSPHASIDNKSKIGYNI